MRELGGFLIQKELGRGATAQVYLATRAAQPHEKVALKVFHPGLWDQADLRRRAKSEFKTVSSLNHPNIVRVLEPLWDAERPAVALEYIDGSSLEDFQKRLPYILPEVAALVMLDVLAALEHAHGQGVVHRDLKPANILVENSGRVLVSDFGLAKMTDVSRLTLSGTILGSPDFMSPEQARGDVTSARSDIFSAAAVFYFLVTGTRPFHRHSPLATLAAVSEAKAEPVQSRNPKISAALSRIIQRGLSLEPRERFESASAFRAEIISYLDSLGLSRENFTLDQCMRSPTDSVISAMKLAAEALIARAETLVHAEKWDLFLESLSHLSLLAPESAAIPRLMKDYESARSAARRRVFYRPAAALALLVILALGSYFAFRRPRTEQVAIEESAAVTSSDSIRTAQALPVPVRKKAASPSVRGVGRIRMDIPEGIQLYWDGRRVDTSRPMPAQPVGKHQIRLEKAGMRPILQTVTVSADEPTIIRAR